MLIWLICICAMPSYWHKVGFGVLVFWVAFDWLMFADFGCALSFGFAFCF